jgi:hypothetical protein
VVFFPLIQRVEPSALSAGSVMAMAKGAQTPNIRQATTGEMGNKTGKAKHHNNEVGTKPRVLVMSWVKLPRYASQITTATKTNNPAQGGRVLAVGVFFFMGVMPDQCKDC